MSAVYKTSGDESQQHSESQNNMSGRPKVPVKCFFYKYRQFIVLSVSDSPTKEDHQKWCSLVECEIPILIQNLKRYEHISLAYRNPKAFDFKKQYGAAPSPQFSGAEEKPSEFFGTRFFIGLQYERNFSLEVDLDHCLRSFWEQIVKDGNFLGLSNEGVSMTSGNVQRQQLSEYLDADILARDRDSMEGLSDLLAQQKSLDLLRAAFNEIVSGQAAKRSRDEAERDDVQMNIALDNMSIRDNSEGFGSAGGSMQQKEFNEHAP